jgi:hypothetical protein
MVPQKVLAQPHSGRTECDAEHLRSKKKEKQHEFTASVKGAKLMIKWIQKKR